MILIMISEKNNEKNEIDFCRVIWFFSSSRS